MWPDLIRKAKDGGLDVIQTYVFWNGHEPYPGKYFFEGRYDLVKFIKLVQQAGLYVHLRIGPFVCAEWNFGGFPVWLKYVPGIEFRTDNQPFKAAMQGFVQRIVSMMKYEKLFEPQGGPIIMSQIENEYGPVEWEIGAPGKAYTHWAASMAVGLGTGVPWIMCKQEDAPDPTIDTCNGFYCEGYKPNKPYKPKMFTEIWTGWYTQFGGPVPTRPTEDLAFAVARFIQNNGSFFNYYMFHGGTNFARSNGLFIATSYDYDAPLDEFGVPRQPKYGHLRDLHKAIKLCEPALVYSYPTVYSIGKNQEAHVFKYKAGGCAAFLSNYDASYWAKVTFQNMQYDLPPWSISVLPDCRNVVFNTAKVSAPWEQMRMVPVSNGFTWQSYNEEIPFSKISDTFTAYGLFEQINVTRDFTDYLWYMTDVNIAYDEGFLKTGQYPILTVNSAGHVLHVYVNGQPAGTVYGGLEDPRISFSDRVKLGAGNNKIALLSAAVGLANVGLHFEKWNTGVLGPVTLNGLNEGKRDLTHQKWSFKSGMNGEDLHLYSPTRSSYVQWVQGSWVAKNRAMTWYKTTFNAPGGYEPLALDMNSMGKGEIWINGESVGRHWPGYIGKGNCGKCNYAGTFTETKCQRYCGTSSQRWYHVPRSLLKPAGNVMVLFEEWGGDPGWINFVQRTSVSAK